MAKNRKVQLDGTYSRYYLDTMLLTLPLISMAWFLNGPRVLVVCAVAFVLGNICDRVTAMLRKRDYIASDYSSESFALMIALLLPASVSWYVLVVAVVSGIVIGKEAFGGYGSYPFHPTAVGYLIAAVSWPEQVFMYPQITDKLPIFGENTLPLVSGISNTLKHGGLPLIPVGDIFLGNYSGPMGTTAVLIIFSCALFLRVRKNIHFITPVVFLFTCTLISFFFPRQADLTGPISETVVARLNVAQFELFSGVMLFGAIMLINEPFVCPRGARGKVLYAFLLGVVTMLFRYYGVYEAGVCFALLVVGSISTWLDMITTKNGDEKEHRGLFSKIKTVFENIKFRQKRGEETCE